MIGNWTIRDILTLDYFNKINSKSIITIIEKFDSILDFINLHKSHINLFNDMPILYSEFDKLRDKADEQLEICRSNDIEIISLWDDKYPPLLKQITYPPILLYIKGQLQAPENKSIAIVGTRRATSYGKIATEKFVQSFVEYKLITVSGLAYGIDTSVHLNTIKNTGTTYAVIASGLDKINPSESRKNADKIIESGGAVISEYKCGTKALPVFFPQRNRIISGIANATLVIESGEKGGSLITAKFAFNQERQVFAVPGSIFSEKSKGTNNLIKNNIAFPAVSPEIVLQEMGFETNSSKINFNQNYENFSEIEIKILQLLDHEPKHIDSIANESELAISDLLVKLLELEFKGVIRQLPGNYYIKLAN